MTITGATLGGVQVRPANAGAVAVGVVNYLTSYKNGKGIEIDGNGGSTSSTLISNSVFNSNSIGINLVTGATSLTAMASEVSPIQNSGTGISAAASTSIEDWPMSITGNTTGVSGNVGSFGTNQLRDNSADGAIDAAGTGAAIISGGVQAPPVHWIKAPDDMVARGFFLVGGAAACSARIFRRPLRRNSAPVNMAGHMWLGWRF